MMSLLDGRPSAALRPDAQAFDEMRIITVPRYKQSGLSGDEWRISAQLQLWRKGTCIVTQDFGDVQTACGFAYAVYARACDDGRGYFASVENKCDQEGCSDEASVFYRVKQRICSSCGEPPEYQSQERRQFCEKHSIRGDCGLDDADANYEPIARGNEAKEKPSE
jgi:hypothetical protein